jgi:hypothetical protein
MNFARVRAETEDVCLCTAPPPSRAPSTNPACVPPPEHCSWIPLSLRVIFCPYLSQSNENWLSNDEFCPDDEDAWVPPDPLRIF